MNNKILIVEDDIYLQRDLKDILTRKQYDVMTASTCKEAMQYILNRNEIDLYLIDVWLPDGEGFDLCRQIRRRNQKPILFLTACDDEASVVKGLDMGADDYIAKPFRVAELLSRIQANLRRQDTAKAATVMKSGMLQLNPVKGIVTCSGREVVLRPVEYRLLYMLMSNAGRIIKREQLLDVLWDSAGETVEDNTLSVHVSRLRSKIGTPYIDTIRGFGYRFTQPVEEIREV